MAMRVTSFCVISAFALIIASPAVTRSAYADLAACVIPECGTASGKYLEAKPSVNLCKAGTPSAVNGSGPWTWTCLPGACGGHAAACKAYPAEDIDGVCGAAAGKIYAQEPETNLCKSGTPSTVYASNSLWRWTCVGSGIGNTALCTANLDAEVGIPSVDGVCGTANKTKVNEPPTSDEALCRKGTPTDVYTLPRCQGEVCAAVITGYGWQCKGIDFGKTATCSATLGGSPINGICGTTNGTTVDAPPTSSAALCSAGSPSDVSPQYSDVSCPKSAKKADCKSPILTGYDWSCVGSGGGTTADCAAHAPIAGICGAANNATLSTAPKENLCTIGYSSAIKKVLRGNSYKYEWTCSGLFGGNEASCAANVASDIVIPVVNGACGPDNGKTVTSPLTESSKLCLKGSLSNFVGHGLNGGTSYAWKCLGLEGGSTATCGATYNGGGWGTCGSANGTTMSSPPTTKAQLCSVGAASRVTASSSGYTWACKGNDGVAIKCSAKRRSDYGVCVIPECGSSNGSNFTSKPTASLCKAGTPSSVVGTGPWTWICQPGACGGKAVSCSTQVIVNGVCGSLPGTCKSGEALSVTRYGNKITWACRSANGGTSANCSLIVFNGKCGAIPGTCSTGAPADVKTTNGNMTWTCVGANGGNNDSCSATTGVKGVCGTTGGTCSVGSPINVTTLNGTTLWTCQGYNGGSSSSCSIASPIDGECSSNAGKCLSGTPTNIGGAFGMISWVCQGVSGGNSVSCSAKVSSGIGRHRKQ